MDDPYVPLLSNLAYPTGLIISPESVKKHGKDVGRNPAGTGPHQFREWKRNQHVILDQNGSYWDGQAGLKSVVFRLITDANSRVTEILSGGIDMWVEVPPDNVATFYSNSSYAPHEQTGPYLSFLILKEGPLQDIRVRQGLNYAINKQALVENVLQNTATVASGPTPVTFSWAYNDALQPCLYDPSKARELVKAAVAEDATLTFYVTEGGSRMLDPVPMGTAIQADLKAIGLYVKIETCECNTFLDKVNPGV